ncbi:MAG: hypothetical protein LBD42_03665 [Desulfovibrio sp.]|nr:hypothetical protein [Desulfovibrio sp.]
MEILTSGQMTDKLQVSRETFRKTWKRFPHIFVGEGTGLRSARFLWDAASIMEAAHGGIEVQDEKGRSLAGGTLSRRRKGGRSWRVCEQTGRPAMGKGRTAEEIDALAAKFGLIPVRGAVS